MTKTVFKKLIAGTAIVSAPLLYPAVASANSAPIVNQEAVNLLTVSLRDTVQAYDSLSAGDRTKANVKLTSAVEKLSTAVEKDPSLGLSTNSGTAQNVRTLHSQLKAIKTRMASGNTSEVQSELERVLSAKGMI